MCSSSEEASGLSETWVTNDFENIIIPMEGETIDSLNVSVSAASDVSLEVAAIKPLLKEVRLT